MTADADRLPTSRRPGTGLGRLLRWPVSWLRARVLPTGSAPALAEPGQVAARQEEPAADVLSRLLQQEDVAQVVAVLAQPGVFDRLLREGEVAPLASALLRTGLLQRIAADGDVAQFTTALAQSGIFERMVREGDVAAVTTALLNAGWLQHIARQGNVAEFSAALLASGLLTRSLEEADAATLMAELARSRFFSRLADSTAVPHFAQELVASGVLRHVTGPLRSAVLAAAAEEPPSGAASLAPPPVAEQLSAHEQWVACKGDQTLRQEYAIAPGELVIDVGGYEGQWASDIYARYRSKIFVFEPVPKFADEIRKRFAGNAEIQVVEAAVGSADGRMQISVSADASSSFGERDDMVEVAVLDFVAWWRAAGFEEIALLKVNIEGGEYELLDHLIATGAIRKVRELQVQFHNFVPDAEQRMNAIQEKLARTHERTYAFKWIWENWHRLPSATGEAA